MAVNIKFPKNDRNRSDFRNPLINFMDAKSVDIERTMVNLYMLLSHNGSRVKAAVKEGRFSVPNFIKLFQEVENKPGGKIQGAKQYPEAVEYWLRANLVNMVNRGKNNEKISSLRPVHLSAYKIRNPKQTQDFNSSDQVYALLSVQPEVRKQLSDFLNEGWNENSQRISPDVRDIDSIGIMRLTEGLSRGADDGKDLFRNVKPFLEADAHKYCDDIRHILMYKKAVPRHVMIEYITVLTAFHLSLYFIKLIQNVPKVVKAGSKEVISPLSLVFDLTDDPDSGAAALSMQNAQDVFDGIQDYIRAVFSVNVALEYHRKNPDNSAYLDEALALLHQPTTRFQDWCNLKVEGVKQEKSNEESTEVQEMIRQIEAIEPNDFERYVSLFMQARGVGYYHRFHVQLLDSLSLKNTESGTIAAGRSRRYRRRFVLGTKLLETLIQLSVLKVQSTGYQTQPISIEELMEWLHNRYGIIINGLGTENFQQTDLNTNQAFRENVAAFRDKLRQIGFYSVLSDAYLLQKIRPRYEINTRS